jgi:hypothetical protein
VKEAVPLGRVVLPISSSKRNVTVCFSCRNPRNGVSAILFFKFKVIG